MSPGQLGSLSAKPLPHYQSVNSGLVSQTGFGTIPRQNQHMMPTTDSLENRVLLELFVHISRVRSRAALAQSHTALKAAPPLQLQAGPRDGDTHRAASDRGRSQVSRTQLAGCRACLTSVPTSQQLPALFAPLPLLLPLLFLPRSSPPLAAAGGFHAGLGLSWDSPGRATTRWVHPQEPLV